MRREVKLTDYNYKNKGTPGIQTNKIKEKSKEKIINTIQLENNRNCNTSRVEQDSRSKRKRKKNTNNTAYIE